MKTRPKAPYRVSHGDGGTAKVTLPDEASREGNPKHIDKSCDGDAYQDLYMRLKRFRPCFTRHIFTDPEGAYREFVNELADQIRGGLLPDPRSLLAQARKTAVRKTSDRIRCLTTAARVLSTLPKRHREVLIRAQLALQSTAHLVQESQRPRRRPTVSGATRANCKSPSAIA